MAAVLVLEAIFEADLQPEQYAYRANRSALEAVGKVHSLLHTGHTEVVDADLSGYFDSIPHAELMKSVARRVSDRHMLHLIKMWLEAPLEEIDERGRHHRTTRNKDEGRGTPQGAPISPLLSNLYMRWFVLGWKPLGHEHRLQAYIVNYADDFVICCRGTAVRAMAAMREMMQRLRLTVNEHKTRQCRAWDESFEFLGYTIGRCYSPQTGRSYLGTKPSKKAISRLCSEISELTERRWGLMDTEDASGEDQPQASGVVELLSNRAGEQSLSRRGPTRGRQAATVVVPQAQGAGGGDDTLPGSIPVREAEVDSARSATAQLRVGERVRSCPKAGRGKTARPV